MNYTMTYLREVVKENEIPSLVTGRVKEADKVERKLRKQHPFWKYSTETQILNNLVDFVGLRVSSYFPDDQKRILKLIEEKFVCIASVHFSDDNELYETSKSVPDDAGKHIVAYINHRYEDASAEFSRSRGDTDKSYPRKPLKNYQRRFGGYTAVHKWVILRPEQREAAGLFGLIPIEIQIRSVLMDSWIAINHDIEYDALTGVLSTQERRILDSIKGLAQTGEVLLEQLHYVHHERLKSDLVTFKTIEDVSKALRDYFGVDGPMNDLFRDPFSYLLRALLLRIKIDNPGKLKLHLKENEISPDFQDDFKRFSANFPMQMSLESYVLPQLLRTIGSDQIEDLWWRSRMTKWHFGILVERTLYLVAIIGAQDHKFLQFSESEILPRSCGFEGLTFLFCIIAWTHEKSIDYAIERYGANGILLSTYMKIEEGVGPFHVIALVNVLLSEPELWLEERIAGVISRLAKFPVEWERGVNAFLKYSKLVISKMSEQRGIDESIASDMEQTGADISKKMFHWMAKWCTVDEMLGIAHTRPDESSYPSTKVFWESMSNYQTTHCSRDSVT